MSEKKTGKNSTGPGQSITRRDFIGSTLIGTGAALLSAGAPITSAQAGSETSAEFKLGKTMPLPLNKLDKNWTGPGGVGDYATANGNTHDIVNAAHTLRNGDFASRVKAAENTDEAYDLVVVGAGFAGCNAAYTYMKEKPSARILVFDNHDMFGGEARQNEFMVDGHKLWGPQGSTGAVWPPEWTKKIGLYSHLWEELGLPTDFEWQQPTGSSVKVPLDSYSAMHLAWESADLGWFHKGNKMAINPWSNRFRDVPVSEKTKQDLLWMEVYRQPPEREDWQQWLDSMTYKDFLRNEMGIDNAEIDDYLNPFLAAMGCGLGTDAVSALQAYHYVAPGVAQYSRQQGLGDLSDQLTLAQFPGGNTGILRHIVKKMIPGIFGDATTLTDILSKPVNWKEMDNSANAVRMRLGSLVVSVRHDGPAEKAKTVRLTYLKDGKMQYVTARHVVMAGQQHLNKRVVNDLPAAHKTAMDQFIHAPILVINVALRNWKFMDKLGIASVRWFDDDFGWFTTLRRQMILDGEEPMPLDPNKPTVLTMYNSFCVPGLPAAQQTVAARMKMFSMSYADIETRVREQFTRMFASGGFDAERDIAGITLNRHGHAYVVTPPGFYYGTGEKPSISDVIRQKHGRVAFAHSELQGLQVWEGAVVEGERAARQLLEET